MDILLVDDCDDMADTIEDEVLSILPDVKICKSSCLIDRSPDVLLIDVSAIGSIHDPFRIVSPLASWLEHRPRCWVIIISGLARETLEGIADELHEYVDNRIDVCVLGRHVGGRLSRIFQGESKHGSY